MRTIPAHAPAWHPDACTTDIPHGDVVVEVVFVSRCLAGFDVADCVDSTGRRWAAAVADLTA